jgi:hypothetical protein
MQKYLINSKIQNCKFSIFKVKLIFKRFFMQIMQQKPNSIKSDKSDGTTEHCYKTMISKPNKNYCGKKSTWNNLPSESEIQISKLHGRVGGG